MEEQLSDIKETDAQIRQRYISIKQAAIYLGLSEKTIYRWVGSKRIPSYRFGRIWRFDKEELDFYVKNQ